MTNHQKCSKNISWLIMTLSNQFAKVFLQILGYSPCSITCLFCFFFLGWECEMPWWNIRVSRSNHLLHATKWAICMLSSTTGIFLVFCFSARLMTEFDHHYGINSLNSHIKIKSHINLHICRPLHFCNVKRTSYKGNKRDKESVGDFRG